MRNITKVEHDLQYAQISQEDTWEVINQFFKENGLVSQQLTSFNSFLQNSLQEIVTDSGVIRIIPSRQYKGA